jgi:hypothetical protein
MAPPIAPRLALAHQRRGWRDLANDGAGLRGAAYPVGMTKDTGRAWLPISMSGMIDTPASINSLVTGKGATAA